MENRLKLLALAGVASALCCGGLATVASAQNENVYNTRTYNPSSTDENIRVLVDGTPVDFEDGAGPIMVDGDHVMVPIRGVFEQMGGDVQWNPDTQTIEGAKPGHMFRITVGSTDGTVNGNDTTLPAPPKLIGGTTYVPLRFASEALGAQVVWNADRNTVYIHTDVAPESYTGTTRVYHRTDDNGNSVTIIKKTPASP